VLLDQNRQLRAELEAIRAAATSGAAAAQLVPARDVAILAATLSVDPAAPGAGLPGSIDGILTASCPQFWTFSPPTPEKSPGRRVEAKGPTGNTGQKGQKWVTP
jgi:hypothetical protein